MRYKGVVMKCFIQKEYLNILLFITQLLSAQIECTYIKLEVLPIQHKREAFVSFGIIRTRNHSKHHVWTNLKAMHHNQGRN